MPTDDLEATFWEILAQHKVSVLNAVPFISDLLRASRAWSAGDIDELTALRRRVLARDGWWLPAPAAEGVPADADA
jgi:hypothetical protein